MVLCKTLHLLVRDVSGNVTCMLSTRKEVGQIFRSTFVLRFREQLNLIQINNFACFSNIIP